MSITSRLSGAIDALRGRMASVKDAERKLEASRKQLSNKEADLAVAEQELGVAYTAIEAYKEVEVEMDRLVADLEKLVTPPAPVPPPPAPELAPVPDPSPSPAVEEEDPASGGMPRDLPTVV